MPPPLLIPEVLAAQLGIMQGAASLEQVAGQVTTLLEDTRIASTIGEGHAASLRAALGGEGTVDEGQVIEALSALLDLRGRIEPTGTSELLRPKVVLTKEWRVTVAEIFEDDWMREAVEGVIRALVGSLNRSKDRSHIRRKQLARILESQVSEPERRVALESALVDFLGAFASELGLPPLEEPLPSSRGRAEPEELPPAVQERLRSQLQSLLDQVEPLVERLGGVTDQSAVLADVIASLRGDLAGASGTELIGLRRRSAALRVRVLRLFEDVLRQSAGDIGQPHGPIEFVSTPAGSSMASFLKLLGFDPSDPALAEAAGVGGATVFGWGERSLPVDMGTFVSALLYINEDLAAGSASDVGDESESTIRQVDPFDFLRLAFGERDRGRAFFTSVQGDNEIVIRYPAYWGEFPYGEIGVPFALGKARDHLVATDADLSRSVDATIVETTVAGHRLGRVAQPQRMLAKTREAFSRMFAVQGESGEAYGEELLFFLTYLPFLNRWIPVTDGRVPLNDADPRLTGWRIQLIPEDAEPAIGIDAGQRFLFSRPPFSYLAEGRIGRLLDETERRLLLYRHLAEDVAVEESVSQISSLRRRLDSTLARIERFQSDPLSRQPGDTRRMEALSTDVVRLAARAWALPPLRRTIEWEGIEIDCVVVPEAELGTFSGQPAVETVEGRYRIRLSLDSLLEVLRGSGSSLTVLDSFLRFEALRIVLEHRSAFVGSDAERHVLAERLFGDGKGDEALGILARRRDVALPPSSGLTASENWISGALEALIPLTTPSTLQKIPWTDRLENYVRRRHGATDAEVAIVRRIVSAYLDRIGDPLHYADLSLLEEMIRQANKKKDQLAGVRYFLLRRMIQDFMQVAGWASRESAPSTEAARQATLTPDGAANLLLGDYLKIYRQLFPRQTAQERYLFLEETVRELTRELVGRLGASLDEVELIDCVRDLLTALDRREGRTLDPLPQVNEAIPQGSRWVLGPLSENPLALSLLSRFRSRLIGGAAIDVTTVRDELAALVDDRRRFLGETTDPAELEQLATDFAERIPVIRTYLNAARALARRETNPEERQMMEFLYDHFLSGDSATLFEAAAAVIRHYPPEMMDGAGSAAIRWVRGRLSEEREGLPTAVENLFEFLALVPDEMAGGGLRVDPEMNLSQHLSVWAGGLVPAVGDETDWDLIVAALVLRLGVAGRGDEIDSYLDGVRRAEREIGGLLEVAKAEVQPPPPPASPAPESSPATRLPTPPPVRLPAPSWDPADYAYFSHAQRAQFWTRVGELASREAPAFLLFHLTEEGGQVARVNREDMERAATGAVRGSAASPYPGIFRFVDQESGDTVELLPTQIRLAMEIDVGVRQFIASLAEVDVADPSVVDLRLLEALAFFLPLDDEAGRDFQRLLVGLMQDRSLWNRRSLRQVTNRYMEKHGANLVRFRNFYANMGPWHFSKGVRGEINQILLRDRFLMNRFEKVVDMIEGDHLLGTEITGPLREAVRTLEAKSERSEADYLELIDRFVEFYPEAIRRETERLRSLFPADAEFQALAEARELLALNSVDFKAFCHRMRTDLERAEQGADRREVPFFRSLMRILDEPGLEVVHRPLQILLYPDLAPAHLVRSLVSLVQGDGRHLLTPKRRERAIREFLRFYTSHRNELLWRIKEREGTDGFEWAAHILPSTLPPRFALSDEFPELEQIRFGEIDECLVYLQELMRSDQRHSDVVMMNIDNDGLWRRVFLPQDQVILRQVLVDGRMTPVPIGVRSGDESVYFREYVASLQQRGVFVELPTGVGRVRLTDALSQEVMIREDQRIGRIHTLAELRRTSRSKPGVLFEYLVFSEDRLRDIHPLLLMIYHAAHERSPQDTSFFRSVDTIAQECLRNRKLVQSQPDRIRRLILEGYRRLRPEFREMGIHGRFSIHFDNPPAGR